MKVCKGLFDHTLDKLETVKITRDSIIKKCPICGYREVLKRSAKKLYFFNDTAVANKRFAAEDNVKELLQPNNPDGSINEEFTKAYGYNPFDASTKINTPKIQGGLK